MNNHAAAATGATDASSTAGASASSTDPAALWNHPTIQQQQQYAESSRIQQLQLIEQVQHNAQPQQQRNAPPTSTRPAGPFDWRNQPAIDLEGDEDLLQNIQLARPVQQQRQQQCQMVGFAAQQPGLPLNSVVYKVPVGMSTEQAMQMISDANQMSVFQVPPGIQGGPGNPQIQIVTPDQVVMDQPGYGPVGLRGQRAQPYMDIPIQYGAAPNHAL